MMGDIHHSPKLKKNVLINNFCAYNHQNAVLLIIKIPAPLALSVNNRYTGLVRANIRHVKSGVTEIILMKGGYFLNKVGGKYHPPTLPRKLDS